MVGLLAATAVILLLVVIFMIARTTELASLLKDDKVDYERQSNLNGWLFIIFLVLFFAGIVYSGYLFVPLMFPMAASVHGVETDAMFNITLVFTGIVFVITHILLFWFSFKYRFRKGGQAFFFPHNNTLELIWTALPAVVMTILVVMGLKTWFRMFPGQDVIAANEDKVTIEVTAKQFGWIIRYPGPDGEFGERKITTDNVSAKNELGVDFSDPKSHDDVYANELILIKDKAHYMKLGALDVLHSFYLPHFRVKMDCVPGIPTSFYFTPTHTTEEYRRELESLTNSKRKYWHAIDLETGEARWKNFNFELACTELCGKSHYAMQKPVKVFTQEEFDAWLAEQTPYYEQVFKTAETNPLEKVEEGVEEIEEVEENEVVAEKDEVAALIK